MSVCIPVVRVQESFSVGGKVSQYLFSTESQGSYLCNFLQLF